MYVLTATVSGSIQHCVTSSARLCSTLATSSSKLLLDRFLSKCWEILSFSKTQAWHFLKKNEKKTSCVEIVSDVWRQSSFVVRWFEEVALLTRIGQPKQITCGQHQPKVSVHLFHGQDEDQLRVFWASLVQFGLRIMCQEGKYKVQLTFSFLTHFWVCKVRKFKFGGMENLGHACTNWSVSESINILSKNILMKHIFCIVVWMVAFNFWFSKIFTWFQVQLTFEHKFGILR